MGKPREFWLFDYDGEVREWTSSPPEFPEDAIHVREVTRSDKAKDELLEWLHAGLAGMFCDDDNIQEMIWAKIEQLGLDRPEGNADE